VDVGRTAARMAGVLQVKKKRGKTMESLIPDRTRALLRSAVFKIVLGRYSERLRSILFFHISLVLQLAKICAIVFAVFNIEMFKDTLWVFSRKI